MRHDSTFVRVSANRLTKLGSIMKNDSEVDVDLTKGHNKTRKDLDVENPNEHLTKNETIDQHLTKDDNQLVENQEQPADDRDTNASTRNTQEKIPLKKNDRIQFREGNTWHKGKKIRLRKNNFPHIYDHD